MLDGGSAGTGCICSNKDKNFKANHNGTERANRTDELYL